jgi:fluoride exporter
MVTALWIAAGGAVGTLARFGIAGVINQSNHPWGTVTVNLVGSLALGVLVGLWGGAPPGDHQLAVTIGLLGGFTTFSTFALDTIGLWESGEGGLALLSVTVSVVGGLAAAVAGLAIARVVGS